jgi:hypothetical protein
LGFGLKLLGVALEGLAQGRNLGQSVFGGLAQPLGGLDPQSLGHIREVLVQFRGLGETVILPSLQLDLHLLPSLNNLLLTEGTSVLPLFIKCCHRTALP